MTQPAFLPSGPATDLADKLLNAYFGRVNREYPLINEAEFRHQFNNDPELREQPEWLGLCFSIFMVGSQFVTDPRVQAFPDQPFSRGMQYWQAARICSSATLVFESRSIAFNASFSPLSFSLAFPFASTSWLHLGGAIRVLLEIGAHRKHAAKKLGLSRLEEESYKRAFWIAYSLDREAAAALGRPLMLQDEDIDVELPIEIDDEYLFQHS